MKTWFKSKTIWTGITGIIGGIAILATGGDTIQAITAIVGGLGLIFARTSTTKI